MPNILSMSFISSSFTSITSSSHSVSHFHPPSPLGFFLLAISLCCTSNLSGHTSSILFPITGHCHIKKKEIIFSVFFFFAFPLDLSVQLQTNSYEIYLHATVTLKHQKTKERPSSNEMTWTVGVCVCVHVGRNSCSICYLSEKPSPCMTLLLLFFICLTAADSPQFSFTLFNSETLLRSPLLFSSFTLGWKTVINNQRQSRLCTVRCEI